MLFYIWAIYTFLLRWKENMGPPPTDDVIPNGADSYADAAAASLSQERMRRMQPLYVPTPAENQEPRTPPRRFRGDPNSRPPRDDDMPPAHPILRRQNGLYHPGGYVGDPPQGVLSPQTSTVRHT